MNSLTRTAAPTDTIVLRSSETEAPSRRARTRKNGARRLFSMAFTVLLLTLGISFGGGIGATASAQPAAAFDIFNPCDNPTSTDVPAAAAWPGLVSLISPVAATTSMVAADNGKYGDSNQATAYEWYGMAGLNLYNGLWSEIPVSGCNLIVSGQGLLGNFVHVINLGIAEIGLLIMGWALSTDVVSMFLVGEGAPVPLLIESMQSSLYITYLIPIILLSAAWLGWRGIVKRRASEAIQGTVWMVGSGVFAALFFLNPVAPATWVNSAVTQVGTTIVEATTGISGPAQNDLCYLPEGAPSRGSRMVQCSLWKTFAYTPWASAQFGALALKDVQVAGGAEVGATFRGYKTLPMVMLDVQTINHDQVLSGDVGTAKRSAQWNAVVATMTQTGNADITASWPTFTGTNTGGRLSVEIVNLLGMLVSAIPSIFLALTLVFQQITFVFLLVLAPIFLTIGIHPGAGRRLSMGWLEMVLGTAVKRLVSYVMLAVMLAMIAAVTASAATGGIIVQIILIAAVSFGVLAYRKRIIDQFSAVNLGGQKMSTGEGNQLLKQATGVLTGAAAGAVGAKIEGESMREAGKKAVKGGWEGRRGMSVQEGASKVMDSNRSRKSGGSVGVALDAQKKLLREEDKTMNSNVRTVDEWVSYSQSQGGRALPRPKNGEMANALEDRGITLRDQIPVDVRPSGARDGGSGGNAAPRPQTPGNAPRPEPAPALFDAGVPAPAGVSTAGQTRPTVAPQDVAPEAPARQEKIRPADTFIPNPTPVDGPPPVVADTVSASEWARLQAIRTNQAKTNGAATPGQAGPKRPQGDAGSN